MPPKGKKKKNPLNDFYFFMQDMKKVFRREGQDWKDMDELVALCHPRLGFKIRLPEYPLPKYPLPKYQLPEYPLPEYPLPEYPLPEYLLPK